VISGGTITGLNANGNFNTGSEFLVLGAAVDTIEGGTITGLTGEATITVSLSDGPISIINVTGATARNISGGTITGVSSKIKLVNNKSNYYYGAGTNINGCLIGSGSSEGKISGGTITGITDEVQLLITNNDKVLGVYVSGASSSSSDSISGGIIKGASGNVIIKGNGLIAGEVYGASVGTISGGEIIGVSGDFKAVDISIRAVGAGCLLISDGTIIGATDKANGLTSSVGVESYTITGGTIIGATGSANIIGECSGIYALMSTATITKGTIIGATGNTKVIGNIFAINSNSSISGGTITGVTGNAIVTGNVYGCFGTLNLSGGTIIVVDNVTLDGNACGHFALVDYRNNPQISNITNGTIKVASGNAIINGNVYGAYLNYDIPGPGEYYYTILNISGGEIYGKESTATVTGSFNMLFKPYYMCQFKKVGSGSAIIQNIEGSGTNFWSSGFAWD